MLYLVGLGLSDETDITVKGLEVVKKASRVYLEAYTSILLVDQSVLVRHAHPFQLQLFIPPLAYSRLTLITTVGVLLWPINRSSRP